MIRTIRTTMAIAALGFLVAGISVLVRTPDALEATEAGCPAGTRRELGPEREPVPGAGAAEAYRGPAEAKAEREREREDEAAHEVDAGIECRRQKGPEPFGELAVANGGLASRALAPFTSLAPGAYAAGVAEARELQGRPRTLAGGDGAWLPAGSTPLMNAEVGFDEVNGLGLVEVGGRIQDFALDPATGRLWAAVANGGVWVTDDLGDSWRSVGDSLPTQIVASVAFSPAGGGTLVIVTGDSAFGGSSNSGLGVYRSTDGGATWTRSSGPPDGVLGFRVAVDPTDPTVIYAATGAGLWRSTDTGATFTDVALPTGPCAGTIAGDCSLANMVTDVVVQAPDDFGHAGGAVLAAVGWRAGQAPRFDGVTPQSPANGLYVSSSGEPGTFTRTATSGFAADARIGRVELGGAEGANQDHAVVYAIVEDAVVFNGGIPTIDLPEELSDGTIPSPTVLEGVYASTDFGATWVQLASALELAAPGTGSALTPVGAATLYAPGVQAWYNEWIRPDPTVQTAAGIPTRLTFGLEEVWENDDALGLGLPTDGSVPLTFKVIGRYFGGATCQMLSLPPATETCPTNRPPFNSTTTHPDQHGAIYVPGAGGGVTLVVGNDGGAYRQAVAAGQDFDNGGWGDGANRGFHTLLPYDAEIANDGVIWAGLQDNGQMRIDPDGRQIATYGGDGFFTAVDPANSNVAYEEYTGGAMSVTIDGGRTWRSIDPFLTGALFSTPFAMDRTDANHLVIGGREVAETTFGPTTDSPGILPGVDDSPTQWVYVYDLGTRTSPGDAAASSSAGDPDNQLSAVDVRGAAIYVGFCGYCDILTQGLPFQNGLATNVGGAEAPEPRTGKGWHIAAATGLPNRYITSVTIDPQDPRHVIVTLGGYGRRWAPPGVLGDDVSAVGEGHVYESTDAGESFRDISGNLPDLPANAALFRGAQLLVGTDVGVYALGEPSGPTSAGAAVAGAWEALGHGLPAAPIFGLSPKANDPDLVVAASYGRGVHLYDFSPALPAPAAAPAPTPAAPTRIAATGDDRPLGFALLAMGAAFALGSLVLRSANRR